MQLTAFTDAFQKRLAGARSTVWETDTVSPLAGPQRAPGSHTTSAKALPERSAPPFSSGQNAWEEFTPFLRFETEIRRIVCTTNAIESVNARIRRAVKARGHFPNEQAALKCVYMAITSLDPTGKGQARWTLRWKTALNAFDITFGRLSAARQ